MGAFLSAVGAKRAAPDADPAEQDAEPATGAAASGAAMATDPAPAEPSAARAAQKRRRKAKKSTVVNGLLELIDHAAAASWWPVDNGAFIERVDDYVVPASQAAVLASELLALHLALGDDDGADPDIDQSLCATALHLVLVTRVSLEHKGTQHPDLRSTFVDHFLPCFANDFPWPELDHYGNIINGLARDMKVNFKVYHHESLAAHVARFLKDSYSINNFDAKRIWQAALRDINNGGTRRVYVPTAAESMAADLASVLHEHGPVTLHRRVLAQIEERNAGVANDANHWPLFAMAPMKSIARQFIVIDTELIRAWDLPTTIDAFFLERKGWGPCAELKTDGVRASLPYALSGGVSEEVSNLENHILELGGKPGQRARRQRAGQAVDPVDLTTASRCLVNLDDVVRSQAVLDDPACEWEAFDPGKHYLLVGHKGTTLSRAEWEMRRGTVRAQQEIERRKKRHGIHELEAVLSVNHLNSADPDVLKARIAARYTPDRWERLWSFWGGRWRARQRFDLKIREQRAYAHMANLVLGPKHDKICVLGSAVFNASQRGLPPTPTLAIRRYLARFGRVVLVDEFRTSKTCNVCGHDMLKHPETWSIFNCQHCKITWSRDVNASRNLATCYVHHHRGQRRPEHLCRH